MVNDKQYPLRTLLTNNNANQSYYLNTVQCKELNSKFYLNSNENVLDFYKTDLRIENISNVKRVPYKRICKNHKKQITIFTHEWALANMKIRSDTEYVIEHIRSYI